MSEHRSARKSRSRFGHLVTDAVPIKNLTSHFAMERMKFTTAYPVDTLTR